MVEAILKRLKEKAYDVSNINQSRYDKGYKDGIYDAIYIVTEMQKPMQVKEVVTKTGSYETVSLLCPKCNWHINDGDKLCRHCGQAITR